MRVLLFATLLFLCRCSDNDQYIKASIIPEPQSVEFIDEGRVRISGCVFDLKNEFLADLAGRFRRRMSIPVDGDGMMLQIALDNNLEREEYYLKVCDSVVILKGGGYAGVMYGLITVEQLYDNRSLPMVEIKDKPRFEWRGMMLDASRHFWTIEETKKFIDILAYHKINKFHWHLTDGVGWRIEIKKYPELTQKAAWRRERFEEAPWVAWKLSDKSDSLAYGGYYTQQQIREIIAYADSKYIEVIPEIEMPGHSDAVLACFPQFACFNNGERAGEFCAGKEEGYQFLFDVLNEVAGLFPSKYIHIGGDEVGTHNWAKCPDCKKKMKEEHITDVSKLQSYFLGRINEHMENLGKYVAGWDEITNFGADSSVVVFSWTGLESGTKAARNGNQVVMCPLDYVYFDHYQGYHKEEPQAWGGDNTLKRVYDFPVMPQDLEPQFGHNILGGQANLWTENIADFAHVQYMIIPRLAALSEALWSGPEKKNWEKFKRKIGRQLERYQSFGWNYSLSSSDPYIEDSWVDEDGNVHVKLTNQIKLAQIRYTLDGSAPNAESPIYDTTIVLDDPYTLMAQVSWADSVFGRVLMVSRLKNLASGKPVKYNSMYSKKYSGGGDSALTDAKIALKKGDDPRWQGFEKIDMDVEIDLGETQTVREVCARFFQHKGSTSVILPRSISISVSNDGQVWQNVEKQEVGQVQNHNAMIFISKLEFVPVEARFVRVKAINIGVLPPWHTRSNENAWLFVDEISVI